MQNTLRARGVLNTSKLPQLFVALHLFSQVTHTCKVIRAHLFSWLVLFNWEGLCNPFAIWLLCPKYPGALDVMRLATRIASRNSHIGHMICISFRQTTESSQWGHELDHDTESVFWLLLYWVVGAQPENQEKELINGGIWFNLMGSTEDRIRLLRSTLDGATHSVYHPLWPLLNKLAAILDVDRCWVKPSDPRKDPGYINEAFQRLILQFILEHRNEEFMHCQVGSQRRHPEPMPAFFPSSEWNKAFS